VNKYIPGWQLHTADETPVGVQTHDKRVRNRHFNLPKQAHNPLRRMLHPSYHSRLLPHPVLGSFPSYKSHLALQKYLQRNSLFHRNFMIALQAVENLGA
jgi:hypothetical protein